MHKQMKARRKPSPQKQNVLRKKLPRKSSDTPSILVPYRASPVSAFLNSSNKMRRYARAPPLENGCNIKTHCADQGKPVYMHLNAPISSYISGEDAPDNVRTRDDRFNSKNELDYSKVVCPTAKYNAVKGQLGDSMKNTLEPLDEGDLHDNMANGIMNNSFSSHQNIIEEPCIYLNGNSFMEILGNPRECLNALEGALPLVRDLSEGYNTLKTRYDLLYSENIQRTKELERLNKKANQQADRITKIIVALDRLQNENLTLKAQHSTFLLYKKEVGKYIEIFKGGLELKENEIRSMHERNDKLEKDRIAGEYECDRLRSTILDKTSTIEILELGNRGVKEQIDGLRERIREVEENINSRQNIFIRENISKCIGNRGVYEAIMGVVKARLGSINGKMRELAQVHSNTTTILFSKIKENGCLKDCLGESRATVKNISSAVSQSRKNCLDICNLGERFALFTRSVCNANIKKLSGLDSAVGEQALRKLRNILNRAEAVSSRVESCRVAGASAVLLKKHYAGLMANQRRRFEEHKAQYEKTIAEYKKGNAKSSEESDKSDIWDIFQD